MYDLAEGKQERAEQACVAYFSDTGPEADDLHTRYLAMVAVCDEIAGRPVDNPWAWAEVCLNIAKKMARERHIPEHTADTIARSVEFSPREPYASFQAQACQEARQLDRSSSPI